MYNRTPNTIDISDIITRPNGWNGVDHTACLVCQRPLKSRPDLWVHAVDGSVYTLAPEGTDPDAIEEAGDMGWWPVGSDCAKRIPAGYVSPVRRYRG